tara:strand:+ start:670 stop:1077 length:408 start_codon:yes stop_codon:yes gene_type:complete
MSKYYVNVNEGRYLIVSDDGVAYPFSLKYGCVLAEDSDLDNFNNTDEDLSKCLEVSYERLLVVADAYTVMQDVDESKAREVERKATKEYRLKLALTCLLAHVRDYTDSDIIYDEFNGLSMDFDEIQDICDGLGEL